MSCKGRETVPSVPSKWNWRGCEPSWRAPAPPLVHEVGIQPVRLRHSSHRCARLGARRQHPRLQFIGGATPSRCCPHLRGVDLRNKWTPSLKLRCKSRWHGWTLTLRELTMALTDVQAAEELNQARAALLKQMPARTG